MAVRIPKIPSSVPWVALGVALIPLAYGLAKTAYRKGLKAGTLRRKLKPKAHGGEAR